MRLAVSHEKYGMINDQSGSDRRLWYRIASLHFEPAGNFRRDGQTYLRRAFSSHKDHLPQFAEKIAEREAVGIEVQDELARNLTKETATV